jgi:leucyl-tRNA synthetase
MAFNTAIAALMECVNNLYKIKAETGFSDQGAWRFALKSITQLLAPFAPHVCEEIWKELGETASVHVSDWPVFDESYLKTDSVTIVVQINGKVRANIDMPQDSDEKFVINAAKENEKVASYLTDQSIKKTIYVKNRLLNIVVG